MENNLSQALICELVESFFYINFLVNCMTHRSNRQIEAFRKHVALRSKANQLPLSGY